MAGANGDDTSSNNLTAEGAALEANGDPVEVSRRYADLAQALYKDGKHVTKMLAVAKAGVGFCLDAAERAIATDPALAETLKNNAKVMAFNAAANSWPGWGDEGVVIEPPHIRDAADLATRSLQLVAELGLGHHQLGNGHWLVGVLYIAGSCADGAIAALDRARDEFRAAGNRPSELMALGYLALARKRLAGAQGQSDELEGVYQQLQQDGSPDAIAFIRQLRTADRLL